MPETRQVTQGIRTGNKESNLVSRIAFGVLGLLLFVVVVVYITLYFGSVQGEEFSADSFSRRRFAYLEMPLIGIQITPIRHTDTTNDLVKYLNAQKLLPKPAVPENRWDLVSATEGVRSLTKGDANVLCQYLDAADKDGELIWLQWSEKHADMAKVLWPAVAEVSRQQWYSFVPDLFQLARAATTPEKLQHEIHATLAANYRLTAETMQALNQPEAAAELFAEARQHATDLSRQ